MSARLILSLIPDVTCILVCAAAVVWDTRERRIPNKLTFPALLLGLAMSFGFGTIGQTIYHGVVRGFVPSFIGALLLFVAFLTFYRVKGIGMGDVKLMAAVGAFLRWPLALWTLAFVLFAGSVIAFIYAVRTGKVSAVFRNMLQGVTRILHRQAPSSPMTLHHMPYAAAILVGVMVSVAFRYAPLISDWFE